MTDKELFQTHGGLQHYGKEKSFNMNNDKYNDLKLEIYKNNLDDLDRDFNDLQPNELKEIHNNIRLPEWLIEKHYNKVYWSVISSYDNLSNEFMIKFRNRLFWDEVIKHNNIPPELLLYVVKKLNSDLIGNIIDEREIDKEVWLKSLRDGTVNQSVINTYMDEIPLNLFIIYYHNREKFYKFKDDKVIEYIESCKKVDKNNKIFKKNMKKLCMCVIISENIQVKYFKYLYEYLCRFQNITVETINHYYDFINRDKNYKFWVCLYQNKEVLDDIKHTFSLEIETALQVNRNIKEQYLINSFQNGSYYYNSEQKRDVEKEIVDDYTIIIRLAKAEDIKCQNND
jgi:hypothetical protein